MHTSYETFDASHHSLVFTKIKEWCEKEKAKYPGEIVTNISHNITAGVRLEGATYHGSCIISFKSPLL